MGSEPERQRAVKRFMPTLREVVLLGLLMVGYIIILKLCSIFLYGIDFTQELHRLLLYLCAGIVVCCVVSLFNYFAKRRRISN